MKKCLSLILAAVIALTAAVPSFAAGKDADYWTSEEALAGVTMFPGTDESERNFSWYSEKQDAPEVVITEVTSHRSVTYTGTSVKTCDSDYANKVTVDGLEPGKNYTYKCVSGDWESGTYSFSTLEDNSFSALYVTDVHVSYDENDENAIVEGGKRFDAVVSAAKERADVSLLLSAGDQGSQGREDEYKYFTASPALKSVTVATAIGNHDRKGVAYKYFKNMPNEMTKAANASYIGGDYWFVKGNVLFMVLESNNAAGVYHRRFMREAVKANKNVKWRVAMMHHDLYSGRLPGRESENRLLRTLWGPMHSEFKVDLVLTGHSHYYTVSDVMYNNRIKQEVGGNAVLNNPEGTVYMVSGSINRPRNDDNLGLNDTVGYYYKEQGDQVLYNIIDFSDDAVTVRSYSYTTGEQFNSLTIRKDSADGGHPSALRTFTSPFVNFFGSVYQFFNNINVYKRLKESGYDVSLWETVMKINK